MIVLIFACVHSGYDGPEFITGNSTSESSDSTSSSSVGSTWESLRDTSIQRGVSKSLTGWSTKYPCNVVPGAVVAQDLDGDDDIDLLFPQPTTSPLVYQNDGTGQFEEVDIQRPFTDSSRLTLAMAAVDISGDGLPELIQSGAGFVALSHNLGNFEFSEWELLLYENSFPYTCFGSFTAGDFDGDNDLDLALAGTDQAQDATTYPGAFYPDMWGSYDLLLKNRRSGWEVVEAFSPWPDTPGLSVLQVFTDHDNDGDLDLFSVSDRPDGVYYPPMAIWDNQGSYYHSTNWEDIAPAVGADILISGMGYGANDLNQDGFLDYCMSDVRNSLVCLISDGYGGFVRGANQLGLVVSPSLLPDVSNDWTTDSPNIDQTWSAWSVIMEDLDNDGFVDVAATGGAPPDQGSVNFTELLTWQPDWLWIGGPDGFTDLDYSHSFFEPSGMYGMASADLDGDGHRELIKAPANGVPQILNNPSSENCWLEIELEGIAKNVEGFGAKVLTHRANDWIDHQEMQNLLTIGQSPSRIHVGCGTDTTIPKIEVFWPDGAYTLIEDVRGRQILTIQHPGEEDRTSDWHSHE